KEINDDPQVLSELFRKLTACGVVPYYVFQCRPVRGVLNHFQVPLRKGLRIVEDAKRHQNGQGKCFRYAMSHPTGKIEILGELDDRQMVFKYHQAKNSENAGRLFVQDVEEEQRWLESVPVQESAI
ncbi:MAG: KamA family radical SAM protein, partial [Lachnospiraceae bacterium]|nr:KamA family radical SAM protein [Lachnospiraceae bacterium]